MSTPKLPSQKSLYGKLNKRLSHYVTLVESLYDKYNLEAAKIALNTGYEGDGEFHFDDDIVSKKLIRDVQQSFVDDMQSIIYSGITKEWRESNRIQDLIADNVLSFYEVTNKKGAKYKKYYQTDSGAYRAFNARRDRGLNLSKNLWSQAEDYKTALEETISLGIQKGTSAITLSKKISQYLKDFDKIREDYTDKFGKASMVKNCEYRSIRLARSEINMAYRTAEQERWKRMDFILGYEIKLSKAHKHEDICDCLAGQYPKDFKWTGWHPNDMCYAVPIIMSDEEFWGFDEDGNDVEATPNYVDDVPKGFKDWVRDNEAYIKGAAKRGTLPYFVKDNSQFFSFGSNGVAMTSVPSSTRRLVSELFDIQDEFRRTNSSISPDITPKHRRLLQEYNEAYMKAKSSPTQKNVENARLALDRLNSDQSYKFLQIDYMNDDNSIETFLSEYFRQYNNELPHGVIEIIQEPASPLGYYMATYSDGRFIFYGRSDRDVRSAMLGIIGNELKYFKYGVKEERALQSIFHEIRHNTVGRYGYDERNPLRYVCESVHELVSLYDYPRFIENIGGSAMFQDKLLATPAYGEFVGVLRTLLKKYKVNEKKFVERLKIIEDANPKISYSDIAQAMYDVNSKYIDRFDVRNELEDMFKILTADYVKRNNL